MNASKRSRTVIWAVVISVAAALLMCCGIPAGLIDRYVLLHIHSYEQPAPDSIGNVAITVDVNPQERIQEPPERLIGPPYALSVMLRDPTRSAVEAKLHWFHMRLPDGQTIAGNISVNHSKWKEGLELTILYVQFKNDDLGRLPTVIADIEIVYPERSVRETLEIPLRATHRRDLYIP
jgi:hypothetical protein